MYTSSRAPRVLQRSRSARRTDESAGRVKIMPQAVRYDEFGGVDVLRVEEVNRPVPSEGEVLVRVKAAGINISEAAIRTGAVANIFPSTRSEEHTSELQS